jgi:inorganic pyrophosphatase
MMWNYGAFPQTWESTEINFIDNIKGDNDPLDCIEIGMFQMSIGSVSSVKVLGVLGMIDDGEMDWKVICISYNDPIAHILNDISDVYKYFPGCLESIREWLRLYKMCQGGVENKFAFDGEFKNKEYALKIIKESHRMWKNLRKINETTFFK